MSIATIGAVAATDTELLIPGIPQIPYALLLTGAGGTTEVIEVRSLQRGGHVYVTRGAFGSLPVAHTAPVVVTLYDPNSGGGGAGVTVTGADGSGPFSATGVQSAKAVDLGAGVIGALPAIVSNSDPGAVGGGTLWLQTGAAGGGNTTVKLWIRRGDDASWIGVTTVTQGTNQDIIDSEDGTSELGLASTGQQSNWASDGSISIRVYGGSPAELKIDTTGMGFFGHAAVAQPAAPVTLGDVIAALKALGLVAS